MIRQQIHHALEGDKEHDLATYLAERHYALLRPRADLWSPDRRDTFRYLEEYPGLPDLVVTLNDGHREKHTYVVEFETRLVRKTVERKHRQFKRYGITDVIVVPLQKFKCRNNLKMFEQQVLEWMP